MPGLSGVRNSTLIENQPSGIVEKLDVRTKMIISILTSLLVIPLKSTIPLLILLFFSMLYLLSIRKFVIMGISYLAISAMILMAILSSMLISLFVPQMADAPLSVFFIPFIRIVIVLNVVLAMALTSKVQGLLSGLKTLKLPYYIYLPATVMIRFIPGFIKDIKQIQESLRTKGYFNSRVFVLTHPRLTIRLLIIPLIIRALRTADELSIAAELKGIGATNKISYYKKSVFSRKDYSALFFFCLIFLFTVFTEYSVLFDLTRW